MHCKCGTKRKGSELLVPEILFETQLSQFAHVRTEEVYLAHWWRGAQFNSRSLIVLSASDVFRRGVGGCANTSHSQILHSPSSNGNTPRQSVISVGERASATWSKVAERIEKPVVARHAA